MKKKVSLLAFIFVLVFVALIDGHSVAAPKIAFQDLGPGLWMAKVDVKEGRTVVDTLVLVKIDPSKNRIRILHDRNIKTIEEWQKATGASVIFNGSYFRENFEPCALVLSDGQPKGPKFNRYMKGMFVAEPKRDDLPRTAILDLTRMSFIPENSSWEQGLQSFPVLIDPQGRIRVDSSGLKASRTAICTTRDDCVLVIHTEEAYFTLHGLATFLKNLRLNIETALNLDGGMTAELCLKSGNMTYSHYGYQISNYTSGNFSLKGIQSRIPMVVGVFPR